MRKGYFNILFPSLVSPRHVLCAVLSMFIFSVPALEPNLFLWKFSHFWRAIAVCKSRLSDNVPKAIMTKLGDRMRSVVVCHFDG